MQQIFHGGYRKPFSLIDPIEIAHLGDETQVFHTRKIYPNMLFHNQYFQSFVPFFDEAKVALILHYSKYIPMFIYPQNTLKW